MICVQTSCLARLPRTILFKYMAFLVTALAYLYLARIWGEVRNVLLFLPLMCSLFLVVDKDIDREAMTIFAICGLLVLVIVSSSLLHYLGLQMVLPGTLVTADGQSAEYSQAQARNFTYLYTFFPLLVCASTWLLSYTPYRLSQLLSLPVLFLPSALVGLYQVLIRMDFLNANTGPAPSGLSLDQSAFGMALFPLIAIGIIGALGAARPKIRMAFTAVSILFVLTLGLRMQRTALLGLGIFLACIPLLRQYSKHGACRKLVLGYVAGLLLVAVMALGYILSAPGLTGEIENRVVRPIVQAATGSLPAVRDTLEGDLLFRERFVYAIPAVQLILKSPLAGWGPAGFCRNFNNRRHLDGKTNYNQDNTGNYYLQLWTELGLLGLVASLLLHLVPVLAGLSALPRMHDSKERLVVLLVSSAVLIWLGLYLTGPHILAPDVAFLVSILLGYLLATARMYGSRSWRCVKLILLILAVAFPLFLLGTWQNSFGANGYRSLVESKDWPFKGMYGLYKEEDWRGRIMRWTMETSGQRLTADTDILSIPVESQKYNTSGAKGLRFSLFVDKELVDERVVFGSDAWSRVYYLPGIKGKKIHLETSVSRTFNPAVLKVNTDNRNLGVALGKPLFLSELPSDGIGFYPQETWSGGSLDELTEEKPLLFRWTCKRAALPLPAASREQGLTMLLMANHPDLANSPVELRILLGGLLVREETFRDNCWRQVRLSPEDLPSGSILSFIVSRTWNPRAAGISDDSRDLGVAFAIRP